MIVKGVEFHDLPLTGIDFAFGRNEIILSFEKYDENSKLYTPLKAYFNQVMKIVVDQIEIDDLHHAEIASMELDESKETKSAKIIMLMGWSKPPATLTFEYASVNYSW